MNPAITLRIRDWERHFEKNRTRELKTMLWISVPNKHDGDGYTILVGHKDGAAHLGAWLAILQVASKCDPRGTLRRENGKPHDAGSISRLTRLSEQVIEEAIIRLCSEEIGWIETIDSNGIVKIPHDGAGIPQADAKKSQDGVPTVQVEQGIHYSASGDAVGECLKSKKGKKLQGTKLEWFKLFWDAFNNKKGKAEAIDAWLDIEALDITLVQTICEAATAEALTRPALIKTGRTPIMAQGWLSGRRWEDEQTAETTDTTGGNSKVMRI